MRLQAPIDAPAAPASVILVTVASEVFVHPARSETMTRTAVCPAGTSWFAPAAAGTAGSVVWGVTIGLRPGGLDTGDGELATTGSPVEATAPAGDDAVASVVLELTAGDGPRVRMAAVTTAIAASAIAAGVLCRG